MKTKRLSRIIALFLALLMMLGALPLSAIAAEETENATPYVLLYSKTCKNSETETLYPGFKSKKYGDKAVLTKDGTLWLNGYDAGPIHAFGFENFSIALKGDNTVYHDSAKHTADSTYKNSGSFLYSAIMAFDSSGRMDYPESLTIRSYSATERGNIAITSAAPAEADFGKSELRDIRAVTAKKLVLNNVNLSFSIDCKERKQFTATGILTYGGLYISNSTVDGKIINCMPDNYSKYYNYSENIYGIWTKGSDTSITASDVNLVFDNSRARKNKALCGIHNSSYNSINIKQSNVNIRDDSRLDSYQTSYGIGSYYHQSARKNPSDNRLNITDSSVVTIEGNNWNYGIYDGFDFSNNTYDDGTTSVTVSGSQLKISGVNEGIFSASRGVNFVNAKVEIRSVKAAVCSTDDENGNQNKAPYGLHISGCSSVDLTSNESKVVSMVPYEDYKYGRSRIELSQGGKVSFNTYNTDVAENVMPMCDYVSLGANNIVEKGTPSEESFTDEDSRIAYTRYYGEKISEILTTFSVSYVDKLNVRWNTSNNTVNWKKGTSPINKYNIRLEAAPNYGVTPVYSEIFSDEATGNSYTLPSNVTKYLIDTMSYRIKLIPIISGSTLSETTGYSNERAAKRQVEDITVTFKDSTTVRWNRVEGATGYYYRISKYNEITDTYEVCQEAEAETDLLKIYDLYKNKAWYGEGKYNVFVRALFVERNTETGLVANNINALGSGELKNPITIKYYSLSHDSKYNNSQFNLTVRRDGLKVENADRTKLLAGDKITLRWTGNATGLNGWYLNSALSGIKKTVSEDKREVEFVMPSADVTAYPLIGVDAITGMELIYDRSIPAATFSDISRRFNEAYEKSGHLDNAQIEWCDEDGRFITDPTTTAIDSSKNYIGSVTLNPKKDWMFVDGCKITLLDFAGEDKTAWVEITNGKAENGCYTFKLYLINRAAITVPRKANGGYDFDNIISGDENCITDLYRFSYAGSEGTSNVIQLNGAKITQLKGEALFGDTPSVDINGAKYSAKLNLPAIFTEELPAEILLTQAPVLHINHTVPVLNYESGTTFYADDEVETEISLVKLDESYKKALANQNAKVYYQVYYQKNDGSLPGYGSPAASVGKDDPIVFKTLGSSNTTKPIKITLTVWVDNGPKLTYYYYAVDAFEYSSSPYKPRLSVEGPASFKERIDVTLVNPLPNLTYYYEKDYSFKSEQDIFPAAWGESQEYNGKRIVLTESARLRIVGKLINSDGVEAYTQPAAVNLTRIYGKPVLNVENNEVIYYSKDGKLDSCIKLDKYYIETLSKYAKVHYTINGGAEKTLDSINAYFPIELNKNNQTTITVWVDGSEKATYTYDAKSSEFVGAQVTIYPGTFSYFKNSLKVMLKSQVSTCDLFQYAVVNADDTVDEEKFAYFTDYIVLKQSQGNTITVNGTDTGKSTVKLAFRALHADTWSSYVTAEYSLYSSDNKATYALVNGNVQLNASTPYYVNGAATATHSADYTARFDAQTGTLELSHYGGGAIYTNGDTYIKLSGYASTVNGTIKCDGDLHIDGSYDLYVTPKSTSGNATKAFDVSGELRISCSSSTINITIDDPYDENTTATDAYGIYANRFTIDGTASLNITIKNPKGDTYGIYAASTSIINTLGNIAINVINGVTDFSSYKYEPLYSGGKTTVTDLGFIKLKHPSRVLFGGNEDALLVLTDGIYRVQEYLNNQYYYETELRKGNTIDEGSKAVVEVSVISSGSLQNEITLELIAADGTVYQALELYGNSIPVSFRNIPLGSYTLKASKNGHISFEKSFEIKDIYDNISFAAILELPSISGTITSYGREDADVTIELWKKDGTSAEDTFIGKGNTIYYSFNNNGNGLDVNSEYYIVVKKSDHKDVQTNYINLETIREQKIDLFLTVESVTVNGGIKFEGSSVSPTVSFIEDTKFDADITEAIIIYDGNSVNGYQATLRTATRYIMTVTAEGYQTYIAYITTGISPISYNISLVKDTGETATVSGKLTSSGDDSAAITVTLTLNGESEPSYETVINGNNAYYGFTEVPVGVYTLKAVKAGHLAWSTSFIVDYGDNRRDITLTKIAGTQIGGTITSFGSDEDQINLWLLRDGDEYPSYELTVSGNNIGYAFYGVEAGSYILMAIKNNHITYQKELTVTAEDDNSNDISLSLIGDLNGDGEVDIRDLVRLKKIKAGLEAPDAATSTDINMDGLENAADLVDLRKLLLGLAL